MKILIVTSACHYPSCGAAQQDIYATIELLREMGNEVALYTLDSPAQNQELIGRVKEKNQIEVRQFRPQKKRWLWIRRALLNWSLFDGSAYAFAELAEDKYFQNYLKENFFDVLLSFGNYSWPLANAVRQTKTRFIIRSHNFEPLHFWEELEMAQKLNPINFLKLLAKWLGERRSVKESDVVAAISPKEVATYRRWKRGKIALLPLVSLCRLIRKRGVRRNKEVIDLFYLGATYNVDFHRRGAEELIEEIAPAVLTAAPDQFRFHLCGSKLPQSLVSKCDGRQVIYEGYVADLESFFIQMDAGVFPVWGGRGMKQKIFEAICRSFPVVAPQVSLGQYPLKDGESALAAKSRQEFIKKVIALKDTVTRERLSEGAYRFAQENFNEEKMKLILTDILYDNAK